MNIDNAGSLSSKVLLTGVTGKTAEVWDMVLLADVATTIKLLSVSHDTTPVTTVLATYGLTVDAAGICEAPHPKYAKCIVLTGCDLVLTTSPDAHITGRMTVSRDTGPI